MAHARTIKATAKITVPLEKGKQHVSNLRITFGSIPATERIVLFLCHRQVGFLPVVLRRVPATPTQGHATGNV
jgi:hypothetical protein